MTTLLVFLVIFSIIVVIHEFGHYFFAKRAGILVREFALGMGPKLFSKQGKDGTTYTVRLLPLGGYVRLAGLYEEDEIQAGMEVGLEINDNDQVSLINLSDNFSVVEMPVRVDNVDLIDEMIIEAVPVGQTDIVKYSVAKKANIIEADGTKLPVAPREMRYESASVWNKMITNFAGPMNNFILSIIAFTIVAFMIGIPNTDSVIGEVVDGSVAQEAGLVDGDRVTEVNGQSVSEWSDLVLLIQERPNEELQMTVERENETVDTVVNVQAVTDEQSGNEIGQIGIIADREFSFGSSITYGVTATWGIITGVLGVIGSMITSGFNINNFGGPVAMAQMTDQVVSLGLPVIVNFLAMLSANLGVFNLLPIPALDGGKIVLNAIEAIRGKPLSESKEGIITIIGVLIMVVLMVAVTWNDINRAFFQ
ncbi:RIP metalloprotease RseP [Aerococcaceae bacterium INB8]|uniref:Zinc metalloprotease n=1 Tax=Ruoffia halotolerans TaxID=2748684 RepID=A0A839A701_9LACT|nr:RIP metalloprotease RseP [Ruoffia halotolerans]MBA5729528.1 RIP metalloprotease RseP [Ruoffia halotolerans]